MKRFVRESKFRHVFGQPAKKGQQFEGVECSKSRLDGNFLACNELFIACVLNLSGSLVATVLRRDKPGRYDTIYKLTGHTSEILDISFDPFCVNRVITGCDNGRFHVFWIQDEGLTSDISEPIAILQVSQRRAIQSIWHPCAKHIVILACIDKISVYNLENYTLVNEIDTSVYNEHLYNISINHDATLVAGAFKDKKVRVFNLRTGKMKVEFQPYDGSKPTRVQFADKSGPYLMTTGFTKMSERRLSSWNLDNTDEPCSNEELDSGVALFNMNYDRDLSNLVLFSKGSSQFSIYEVDTNGKLYFVSGVQHSEQIKAGCFANKLACDVTNNEIMHFIAATNKNLEPLSFIVPRKSTLFQSDIFPPTNSNEPSMTAEDYLNGDFIPPLQISLEDYQPMIGNQMPEIHLPVQVNQNALHLSKTMSSRNSNTNSLEARVAVLEAKLESLLQERQ